MNNPSNRTDRVAGQIQRKLAQIIQQEIKDPRLPKFVTISEVKVSRDLSHAKIYFTALNADPAVVTQILNTASSYLRTALARTLSSRIVPALHFVYDESILYATQLTKLIDEANQGLEEDAPDQD